MKTSKLLCGTLVALALTACGGGSTDDSSTTPATGGGGGGGGGTTSDGSQSVADMVGNYQVCAAFPSNIGTHLAGQYYTLNLKIKSDNTYEYSVFMEDNATSCAGYSNALGGGHNYATYYQYGTIAVHGTNTVPSVAATKVELIPTSQDLVIRGNYAEGATFANWVNAHCAGVANFSNTAYTDNDTHNMTCTGDATYNIGNAPANSTSQFQIFYNNGTYLLDAAQTNIFTWGQTSYPSSFDGNAGKKY